MQYLGVNVSPLTDKSTSYGPLVSFLISPLLFCHVTEYIDI